MGWWSTDIIGGDTPMDFEDEFYGIANINKFPEDGGIANIPKKAIEENMSKFAEYLENEDYEPEIGWQVLAVLSMRVGAKIPVTYKADMIVACDNDRWAQENPERKKSIDNLKDALLNYDQKTPIKVTSKGLFQTIAEKITDGNAGLVNVTKSDSPAAGPM